jgi:PAS domain S-box-containing protein
MRLASASARAAGVLAAAGDGFILDLHVAVGRPAGLETAGPAPGVLVMSLDPAPDLARFLEPSPLFGRAERYVLVQDEPEPLALALALAPALGPGGTGLRQAAEPAGGGDAYAAAAAVDGTAWRLVAAMDRAVVLAPLDGARDTVLTVSAAAFVVLFLVMLAVWLNQTRQFNEALAADYARSARRIDDQRRLLARINEAIADGIGLTGPDGAYVQVNPAFARIVGRPAAEIEGQADEALFGRGVAERLADARAALARRDEPVAIPARLAAGDTERDVDILPVPLRDADGRPERWLTVIHDRTGERAARRRRDQAATQMTVAFMKAIELADDWLHGQGAFVSEVALMLADRTGAAERERETVRIAAGLYQIGKLFIPREILLKEGPLNTAETATMHGHVARLVRLVEGMDFGYPVQAALATLHERLDGSGYPKGLAGEAIGPAARVLGVADAFCALVRPRPWRPALTPEAALAVIEDDAVRYDAGVVAALRTAVGDGAIARVMARLFPTA